MTCTIRFLPSGRSLRIERDTTTLLEASVAVGLPIANACGERGACGRCGLEVVEGADGLEPPCDRERRIKQRNRIDADLRLACRVRPRRDLTVRARYW